MPDQGRKRAKETKRSYQAGHGTQTTTRVVTPRWREVRHDTRHLTPVELFAGAGGLGMGVGRAGFESKLVVDWDGHACATIRTNQALNHPAVASWPLRECDVREVDFRAIGTVDLVSGGPPCQPFSLGGKHNGPLDSRDMFPEAIRAVRELTPRAFVFENVPGLKRPAFSHYLGYVRDHLTFPELLEDGFEPHKVGEVWINGHPNPDLWIDVTDHMDTSIRAIVAHESQIGEIRDGTVERMSERLRHWRRERAIGKGMQYAETFKRISFRR